MTLTTEQSRAYETLRAALEQIAMFNDRIACEHLKNTGSYSVFDEPRSVTVARAALEIVGGGKIIEFPLTEADRAIGSGEPL